MFKSFNRMSYPVPDLARAKDWYRALLKQEPVFDSPFLVSFAIGDSALSLTPSAGSLESSEDQVVAFWNVDDTDEAYRQLLEAGASSYSETRTVFNTRVAKVRDPFDNVMGIMSKVVADAKKSLDNQPSDSALTVAFCRALAAAETRLEIKGPDNLAELFLMQDGRRPLKDPATREWLLKNAMKGGAYEFFIARTAHLDGAVKKALRENIPQIVFLGAGYDSRACRFREQIQDTRIFELDVASTQQRKRKILDEAHVALPERLSFVPINFAKQTLEEALVKAGFQKGVKTLYIWEGVTYYLPAQAVDNTLDFVHRSSVVGSAICFDYLLEAPDIDERYGVRLAKEGMRVNYPAEPIQFGIEEGKIESFLWARGLKLVEHLTAEEMEQKYLTLADGTLAGKVLRLFCLAHAVVCS
jgi:methyltransferase (TIGR00027 family)